MKELFPSGSRSSRAVVRSRAVPSRPPLVTLLAVLLLSTAACFEKPIDEELEIRFPVQGGLVASSSVRIVKPEDRNAALDERLARARRELEAGTDVWSPELAALNPLSERMLVDRRKGEIVAAVHRVYVKDRSELRALLARSAGSVHLSSGEGWSELALAPLPGSRAGEADRRRSAQLVEDWSGRIVRYLESVRALYRYLDAQPDRAEICLAPLLGVGEGGAVADPEPPPPSDEEKSLISPVQDSVKDLIEMFSPDGASAYTPDEIVRLANDPFPTRLAVVVPGKVLDSEGFVARKQRGESRLAVPEGGLFGAIASLEGTWIAPDILVTYVRLVQSNGEDRLDLAEFAARPRVARGGATPAAVRREMEKALAPATSYRVRWAVPRPSSIAPGETGKDGGAAPAAGGTEDEAPDDIDWDALTAHR